MTNREFINSLSDKLFAGNFISSLCRPGSFMILDPNHQCHGDTISCLDCICLWLSKDHEVD